jgi:molecular chaperone DnaK
MEGDDPVALKKGIEDLTQASHRLAELMYSQATAEKAGTGGPGQEGGAGGKAGGEDVVDADYEEVK